MKKKVLIVLFSVFVAGFYAQAQAQKVNVVSVSKERDIHNFYTMMKEAFPSIVDVNFTATMEDLLDKVGDGTVDWKVVVRNFYPDLDESVKEAEKNLEEVKLEDEVTDVICENCGRNMVIKYGPHGKFLACPGFPDCRNTKPYLEKIGVPCPVCGKDVVIRKTKKGRRYYGCEDNQIGRAHV